MFILFEGPEGSGKTTMALRLFQHTKRGTDRVTYTREPGGQQVSEAIRKVLLNPVHAGMSPLAEFFLFQAARAEFVQKTLVPLLDAKHEVIQHRYSLSTMAYQIAGRGLPVAPCLSAIELATGGLIPDITFLLMCSYENGKARQLAAGKSPDRLEAEDASFHRKIIQGYRNFANLLPDWNIVTIETDHFPEDVVFNRILLALQAHHSDIS